MYTLYFDRSRKEIEVKKARKAFQNCIFTEEITRHNDCIYLCTKRKPLVEKAKEIQNRWILELVKELELIRQLEF